MGDSVLSHGIFTTDCVTSCVLDSDPLKVCGGILRI